MAGPSIPSLARGGAVDRGVRPRRARVLFWSSGVPRMSGSEQTYFQKGFNLKKVVGPVLAQSYHSQVVDRLKELGYAARAGEVKVKLAREFGFCYGVDRAVEYAYETREKFPDRRIFLSGEIIHNPEVNGRIESLGIRILPDHRSPEQRYAEVEATDVVILPAFGVPVAELQHLRTKGCVLVDTTCGSVLNVWKNVHRYARDGFTVGHPRQALPRGDEGHRLPGPDPPGRALPLREGPARGRGGLPVHPRRGGRRRAARAVLARPRARASTPSATSSGSASPTRRPC